MDSELILSKVENVRKNVEINPFKDYKKRIEKLKLLYTNIKLMENEINEALYKDLNKSKEESYMTEICLTLNEISNIIKHCRI